ncbi:MAG TPA: metallophosphoesterase [Solirubrobacterales bacterium]|nr:metallophosphoesterase [Solirubrobacterales bacterium]
MKATEVMLTFLQLSDIHFRNRAKDDNDGEPGSAPDPDSEAQDYLQRELLIEDARQQGQSVGGYSAVLVAGDIASVGEAEQFAQADTWLRNLCTAIEVKPWLVWTVPGNHDVADGKIGDIGHELRKRLREAADGARDALFAQILAHAEEGPALLAPLQSYLEFADAFDCAFDVSRLHWSADLAASGARQLQLRGVSSALLCAPGDAKPKKRPTILGEAQASDWADDRIHLSLCHHPHCWLLDVEEIDQLFGRHVQVRVTGHLHRRDLSHTDVGIYLQAGAVSPQRSREGGYGEGYEPTYDVITVDQVEVGRKSYLEVAVRCRRWDDADGKWVAHGEEMRRFAIGHDAPSEPLQRAPEGDVEVLDVPMREARYKLAQMPQTDKLEYLEALGGPMGDFIDAPQWSIVTAIFDWARDNGKLEELQDLVINGHPPKAGD